MMQCSAAAAATRLPRVRTVLIIEAFLSKFTSRKKSLTSTPSKCCRIQLQAAKVALPTMFIPAASPVVFP